MRKTLLFIILLILFISIPLYGYSGSDYLRGTLYHYGGFVEIGFSMPLDFYEGVLTIQDITTMTNETKWSNIAKITGLRYAYHDFKVGYIESYWGMEYITKKSFSVHTWSFVSFDEFSLFGRKRIRNNYEGWGRIRIVNDSINNAKYTRCAFDTAFTWLFGSAFSITGGLNEWAALSANNNHVLHFQPFIEPEIRLHYHFFFPQWIIVRSSAEYTHTFIGAVHMEYRVRPFKIIMTANHDMLSAECDIIFWKIFIFDTAYQYWKKYHARNMCMRIGCEIASLQIPPVWLKK